MAENGQKWQGMVKNNYNMLLMVIKISRNYQKWSKMAENVQKCRKMLEMFGNVWKCILMPRNDRKRLQIGQNGLKVVGKGVLQLFCASEGSYRPKMAENGQNSKSPKNIHEKWLKSLISDLGLRYFGLGGSILTFWGVYFKSCYHFEHRLIGSGSSRRRF